MADLGEVILLEIEMAESQRQIELTIQSAAVFLPNDRLCFREPDKVR